MRALRWLLVLPAAWAGWWVGLGAFLLVHQLGEWTCSREHAVSGACSDAALQLALAVEAGVAGAAIVWLPAVAAPRARITVAAIAFVGGAAYATYMHATMGQWVSYAAALCGGVVALWGIIRRVKRR